MKVFYLMVFFVVVLGYLLAAFGIFEYRDGYINWTTSRDFVKGEVKKISELIKKEAIGGANDCFVQHR